jgi:transposase InsO family protein
MSAGAGNAVTAHDLDIGADLPDRQFQATGPEPTWAADITHVWTANLAVDANEIRRAAWCFITATESVTPYALRAILVSTVQLY